MPRVKSRVQAETFLRRSAPVATGPQCVVWSIDVKDTVDDKPPLHETLSDPIHKRPKLRFDGPSLPVWFIAGIIATHWPKHQHGGSISTPSLLHMYVYLSTTLHAPIVCLKPPISMVPGGTPCPDGESPRPGGEPHGPNAWHGHCRYGYGLASPRDIGAGVVPRSKRPRDEGWRHTPGKSPRQGALC